MKPIGILMIAVGVLLLIMALMVYKGETGLIRTFNWTSVTDKKAYARFLGKALGVIALTAILTGIVVYFISPAFGIIAFIVLFIAEMIMIAKKSGSYYR